MTDWLLHTLLATSGLIVAVLLLREPVRKQFGIGGPLPTSSQWPPGPDPSSVCAESE